MQVRPVQPSDANAVTQLCRELGYPAALAEIAGRIGELVSSANDCVVAAVDPGEEVVGWLHAHASIALESGFRVEIIGMVVAASHRRKGVGKALVQAAEAWAREKGAHAVVVRSNLMRVESHAFYPALGYEEKKTQRVYRKAL